MAIFTIGLRPGLNVISVPLIVTDNLSTIFGGSSVEEVRRIYNGIWQSFIPTRSFNDFDTLEPQYGYLIQATGFESITISGTEPLSTIFALNGDQTKNEGLNLVGVPISGGDIAITDYFVDRLTLEPFDIRIAFEYNTLRQNFISYVPLRPTPINLTTFKRGRGYVVLSDESTEVEIEY